MKKILFLLLLITSSIYAQSPTGQEQEFDYGIRNNAAQQVTSTDTLVTHGVSGTYGKISRADLLNAKANLSTGLLQEGLLTINADNTKFDLSSGTGVYSDFTDPNNVIVTIFTFPSFIGVTPAFLNTGVISYVAVNYNGGSPVIVQQATPFTNIQRRDYVLIGALIHSNLTNINVINEITAPAADVGGQLGDVFKILGNLNFSGNKFTANGANLTLDKTAGTIFKYGSNFEVNHKDPHYIAQTSQTSLSFRYRSANGIEGADRINLDPDNIEIANVLTALAPNTFSIQTVFLFQSGTVRIQRGQTSYASSATARAAINTREFVVESNIGFQSVKRAYIIMRKGTTSLLNTADAEVIEATKYDGTASGGVALTLDAIISALGYTPENVANKTGTLTASSTLYPNNNSVIAGLNTKNPLIYNNSFVDVLSKSASVTGYYFKKKTEGSVFFALGTIINGQAVQYDFAKDQDTFARIAFAYSNVLSGGIMDETGRKTLSAGILEYAINMRQEGSGLSNNWIPNHTPATTGAIINIVRTFYIDGVLTDVDALPVSNFAINEFTMVQKYNGCNIGSAVPLFEIVTTHKFKDGKLSVTNNITALQSVEMFQGYSAKITGYLANISNLKIDNGTKITPTSTDTNFFYDIPAKSAVFYGDNEAIAIEVGRIGESINFGKSYSSGVNKLLYWDRALTPSIYWQWLPNISGGVAGTGTILPIGTKLVSQNTIFTSTNINTILK